MLSRTPFHYIVVINDDMNQYERFPVKINPKENMETSCQNALDFILRNMYDITPVADDWKQNLVEDGDFVIFNDGENDICVSRVTFDQYTLKTIFNVKEVV